VCIDLHQTGFVGEGSDHLQLIKFWPSCVPGKGSVAGRKSGSALLQLAHSVYVSERFLKRFLIAFECFYPLHVLLLITLLFLFFHHRADQGYCIVCSLFRAAKFLFFYMYYNSPCD